MKLFSEKVTPTFTSSNQNILTIKEFNEIFFDVYELEINGNKYIAEKISEYKGNPVVNIPVVIDGKEFEAPFVLQTGKFDIIFNERNSTFVGNVKPEVVEVYNEVKSQEEEVEEIIFEKRESILEEIQQARQLATKFAEDIKQEKIRAADVRISKDKAAVINTANKFKSELIDEFLALTENTREELYTYTQEENKKSYDFIVETVTQLADKLTQDLNQEVGIQTANSISVFEEKIDNLAKNILTNKLLKTISQNNVENDKKINLKFETVSKTIAKVLGDYEVQLNEDVKLKLENFDSQILTLEKNSVELNNTITKNTNKALSRIGNVKTQLEEAVVNVSVTLSDELTSKIALAESKIKDYYDERITLVESSITDITAQERAHILNVIQESKQSILDEVYKIKTSVPSVIAEKTREPKGEADIQKIKTDLEKTISNRFTQELANVRRIIELSSGGGSVAVQFANGGTMNGNLTVVGTISASQYLGIPVYTDTDTLSTVTARGNITTDSITVSGVNTPYVTFDITAVEANAVGKLKWNDEDGTLDLGLKGGNVTLQVGQEMVIRAVNKTNANLLEANYQVARIRTEAEGGSQGQRLAIVLAQANNDNNSVDTLGLVTENINNNQEGFITTFGLVRGINTTGSLQGEDWNDGDVLYLSPTIAGRLTNVKPEAPQHTVIVGFVVHKNKNQGKIFVKVDNGYELNELHNVKINGVTNNSLLAYDSALGVWRNSKALDVESVYTDIFRIYTGDNYCQINAPALTTNISFTLPNTSGTIATNNTAVMLVGAQTVNGNKTFNGQILIPNQIASVNESVMTRELSDARYGTYSDIEAFPITSDSDTFITIVSITLPIGIYQFDAFLASSHNTTAGCKIRLGTDKDVKIGVTDNYGRPAVAAFSAPIINNNYNSNVAVAIRQDTGAVEYRRTLSGVIEVISAATTISLDYAQAVTTPLLPSTARARSYIIARPII